MGGEARQQSRESRFSRSRALGLRHRTLPGRPAEPLSPTAVAPEADVSVGQGQPPAPPRAIASGGTSPRVPRVRRAALEGRGRHPPRASCAGLVSNVCVRQKKEKDVIP